VAELSIKSGLIEEIDTLDNNDKHYIKHKADLDNRLCRMYDKINDTQVYPTKEAAA